MDHKFEPLNQPMSSTSSENLLDEKQQLEDEFLENAGLLRSTRRESRNWKKSILLVLCQVILIMVYTAVTLVLLDRNNKKWIHGPNLIHSPARGAHEYERVTFDGFFTSTNPYKGPWRPELDDAWGLLLENSNIVVSKADLEAINKTSVQVPDGSGYLATLDVHHQLHCIKQIRQYLHPEQYTMDEPNIEVHIDHCLDDLRMMMMCKADISLLTYEWIPHYKKPFPVWDVTHECTNWEKLDAWAGERSLDMSNIPVHPELMGGWVDPDTMSADARYFLEQVRVYEAQKEKSREDAMRASVLADEDSSGK